MSLGVVAVAAVLLGWSARYCSSETTNDAGNGTYPFGSYTDWDRMERYLEQLANDNDKFVRLVDIGETNQGRRLRGLKIGTSNGQNNVTGTNTGKRAIWIDGGNHAREWPAFHTVLVFIHKLVDGYNNGDPNITAYIHKFELAEQATAALKAVDGNEYKIGTAADLFGPASGGATDWIKANTRIKYVYVVELPPELTTWFAFQMKPHWLMPTAEETWAAVKVIIEHVIEWREL